MTDIIATIILGLAGVYYSYQSKRIADDKMMKELFTEFNQRYNSLNDDLDEIERNFSSLELFNKADDPDKLRKCIIDYFNLCAEEWYWYNYKKRINPIVWKSWKKGMNYWYSIETIRQIWEDEVSKNGKEAYYITGNKGFFDNEK